MTGLYRRDTWPTVLFSTGMNVVRLVLQFYDCVGEIPGHSHTGLQVSYRLYVWTLTYKDEVKSALI